MGPKSGVLLILLSLLALSQGAAKGADEKFRLSAPRCWWGDWAQPPWIPLVGDADGDGRADLVAVEPPGGTISVERTSPLGKWVQDPEPNIRFGNDVVAAAVGPFTGDAADELLALGRDGSLRLAFGMKRGTRTYTRVERVGEVPAADLPMSVARALSADINHDGRIDVLVPRGDGRLLVLLNRPGDGGRPRFDRSLALGAPSDATEIDVGTFGAPARSGWYGSTQTVDSMPPQSPLPVPAFKSAAPSACSKSAAARIWRWEGSSAAQATTSSQVANSSPAAIPPRPSRFERSRPPLSGRATPGGAPATSTAMAWMTSSASGRSPRPRAALKSRSNSPRTGARHNKASSTTTWTVCPTPGSRARSGREG